MTKQTQSISYLVTVSDAHFLSAQMLISTLRLKTDSQIVVVGNISTKKAQLLGALGAKYIDENEINLAGRMPNVKWSHKHRELGWYKQQFIRLSIDRFMKSDQVIILDSEVFVFDNWSEERFYDPKTGQPRYLYWVPSERKPEWDYVMYRGASYLLSFLPECRGIDSYVESDSIKRSISGVNIFSTKNIQVLWQTLETKSDLQRNLKRLFESKDKAFSEYVFYGLAVEYGLFTNSIKTRLYPDLLGWYDNHDDSSFNNFKQKAMWSMCQSYMKYNRPKEYDNYMNNTAKKLKKKLPNKRMPYWNVEDIPLIKDNTSNSIKYFTKYKKQLDHTFRKRYKTMYTALQLINKNFKDPIIVEIGTLRDNNMGGGHSTYKFGEYCSRFGGTVHTVDILQEAIDYSIHATKNYQPYINYHISDSTTFLKNFDGQIDLLYLDGYDSTPGNEKAASKKQLEEIKAALPKLSKNSVVLLDDADLPEGGKASLSSTYLLNNGYKLKVDGYQQLYVKSNHLKVPRLSKIVGKTAKFIRSEKSV